MAITFKINQNRDYTIMPNHHLRNRNLSLKAKGLHSLMISLPEEWDYTLNGLTTLSKDGRDGVLSALKELETTGYLVRKRNRNSKGQLTDTEYIIYPQPITENPTLGKPITEKPVQGKHIQSITNQSITNLINYPSIYQGDTMDGLSGGNGNRGKVCGKSVENSATYTDLEEHAEVVRTAEIIREQINYTELCKQYEQSQIDNIVEVISDVYQATEDLRIGRQAVNCEVAKSVFSKLDYDCIVYVMDSLAEASKKSKIKNIKKYLLTVLYNAPKTMSVHYGADVNYDLANG